MNVRAKCSNRDRSAFGIEKSVLVGQMLGYGAARPGKMSEMRKLDNDYRDTQHVVERPQQVSSPQAQSQTQPRAYSKTVIAARAS
jgi:hypothetical protein